MHHGNVIDHRPKLQAKSSFPLPKEGWQHVQALETLDVALGYK